MTRKRPIAVMVFGILNLVFGPINLLMFLCCGLFVVGIATGGTNEQMPPADQKELEELRTLFTDNIPGALPAITGFMIGFIGLAVLQVVSGIGLVIVRNWGRVLCVLWAFLKVATTLALLGYWMAVVVPGLQTIFPDLQRMAERQNERNRQLGKAGPPHQDLSQLGDPDLPMAISLPLIISLGVYALYAGLAFIFMVLPNTPRAIARYHGQGDDYQRDRPNDYYDERPPPL